MLYRSKICECDSDMALVLRPYYKRGIFLISHGKKPCAALPSELDPGVDQETIMRIDYLVFPRLKRLADVTFFIKLFTYQSIL
jgi:hypothetical protein